MMALNIPQYLRTALGFAPSSKTEGAIPVEDIGLYAGAKIVSIAATAVTLDNDAHHARILDFTAGSAVTVSVPNSLRPDFFCGISQGGAGQVTVAVAAGAAGVGVTLNEPSNQLKTSAQFVMLSLIAFSRNTFRLFGSTAA
ncbi:hypothetical protein ABIF65_003687 [Bradyrhizobium japonicum]|jgi:hypothetical protein|nr:MULTISPECIES: hypothetical protein [Bradyrhizobium]MBR1004442.1 hypothetical protein [Bradyrhizobium liaoningense]MBR1070014.1 hypothetical protein [Bradyrhizobium liaoningense]MCP1741713.1 hypothetical protein [Bradyrhizobium japonicum]MCP1779463.1 hypothetical protein [Bradyrhizobium japonicum]MCP1859423.1 hypothetical protein [Bradyrhizobium japonicum]